ncbi:MAG TPA: hypothetical protein VLZ74_11855 [Methylocella sp.]|nr:hypothetical protein [Methylocella sp.]
MARPTPSGKRTPPGTRARIGTLDIIIVILGIVGIIGFNRMSIARLQRSLPNANSQIVGEWKSTRGPDHLVFRADKTLSLIVPAQAQADGAAPSVQTPGQPPAAPEAAPLAPAAPAPAPVTGKYQLSEGGKVYVELSNGKKYTTMIAPQNRNRFDLIDSETDGVTTYERVP